MQLSGRSKGSSVVHQLQQMNGIVKQPLLRHRNNESDTNSKSIVGECEQDDVTEQSRAPPELQHNSGCKVDSDNIKPDLGNLDSKMEITENGASEMSENSENSDSKLATELSKGEIERSDEIGEVEPSINGESVKNEEEREKMCKGERGEELLANEEHMEVSGDKNEMDKEEHPQGCGFQPGFGKHNIKEALLCIQIRGVDNTLFVINNIIHACTCTYMYLHACKINIHINTHKHMYTHTHTHTVPDLTFVNEPMVRLLAMQRLQGLFTESSEGSEENLLPPEATAAKTKLSLNGIRQLVQPVQQATPVPQTNKQIKYYPSTGKT